MEWGELIKKVPLWLMLILLLFAGIFLIYSSNTGRFLSWSPFGITTPVSEDLAQLKLDYELKNKEVSELRKANENLLVSDSVILKTLVDTEPLDDLGIAINRMAIEGTGPFGENVAQLTINLLTPETDTTGILNKDNIGLAAACDKSPVFNHETMMRSDWVQTEGKPFFKEKGLLDGFDVIISHPGACNENSAIHDSNYEIWVFKRQIQERFRIDLTDYSQINSIAQLLKTNKRIIKGKTP